MTNISTNASIPDLLLVKQVMLNNMQYKKMVALEIMATSRGTHVHTSDVVYLIDEMIRVATKAFGTLGETPK